ncbi:hypothetical protein OH708_23380 [Pseudomonas capsici]|uniref:hypothetical protein n=1 Tax=Pseudomonas capsici TaxID=2810614 RepID=UPI0021F18C70|nr:hypothetical protein [Pseudomonas capsici]MCV4290859.1 hypothetical protein [Pseudomonas capsici]
MKRRAISPASLPAIGQTLAGGFYAGRVFFDGAEFALIDSGRDYECAAHWWDQSGPRPRIRDATSRFDGMANTLAMSKEGSAIATKVLGMNIRGTWGWHIPSIEELNVIRANLLQLEDWDHSMCMHAKQEFSHHQYWSSTQKKNAATAWLMGMHPWSIPDTNWVSGCNGIRPVKVLQIKPEALLHEPSSDMATSTTVTSLGHISASPAVAEVLGQFINEDAGRFYGRTQDLLTQLAAITVEART